MFEQVHFCVFVYVYIKCCGLASDSVAVDNEGIKFQSLSLFAASLQCF